MLLILGTGLGAILIGSVLGYALGLRAGRKDKLDELMALQDEGWLTITYMGDNQSSSKQLPRSLPMHTHRDTHGDDDQDIASLLYGDDAHEVTRPRRDADERRDDWAHAIKARRDAEAAQASDDDDEDIEPHEAD